MLPAVVAADSVRRLGVAIVLLTNSFNKTLTPAEIERVHEEVAEFHAFYQRQGAGKVDFAFTLVQIDRPLARREIAEVSPGRYYLSRDNLEAELVARGFRGRFDEVIALHAWSNANPERALQAYGGGAVGPDGKFLGDAGFNSIPVMGRDPNTIGQVLIHEVLHNLDDMFARSGMPDEFLNSDEMSRNMAQLLRERPGAFLPHYTDAEMLAYAEREREGREAYPWAMQLVYYAWMLERTPQAAWDRLRYGRLELRGIPTMLRPLYDTVYTSAANDSVYLPVLGSAPGVIAAGPSRLAPREYVQSDFDGAPIARGRFLAVWAPLRRDEDTTVVAIVNSGGVDASTRVVVVRQRVAHVAAEPVVVRYVEAAASVMPAPAVLADRCCAPASAVPGAQAREQAGRDPATLPLGTHELVYTAVVPGWYVHPGRTRLTVRRSWRVTSDGPLTVALGAPVTLNAIAREDRGRTDAAVTAWLPDSSSIALQPMGDGRYSVTLSDGLGPGLHWVRLDARAPDGTIVRDSVRVYVRPAGWIRAPAAYALRQRGRVMMDAVLWGRMGSDVRDWRLPLVAVVGDRVTPFAWWPSARTYYLEATLPPAADRFVVTSLEGDPQRRVVLLADIPERARVGGPPRLDSIPIPPHAAAPRLDRPPRVDGDLTDWPATAAAPVRLGARSFLLTDTATYHGDRDLAAAIRFAWDDSTLYVAGDVTDDSVTAGESWDTDRVNVVFDMKDDTSPVTYTAANPPLNEWQDDDYWVFWRNGGTTVRRLGKTNADPVPGARLATRRTASGWSFEVAIPRAQLPGYVPFVGQVAGLQVFVTDGDGEASATELMWSARWPYGADGIEWRLAELAHLLFVDAPIP